MIFFQLWKQVIAWFNWGYLLINRTYFWCYSTYGSVTQPHILNKIFRSMATIWAKTISFFSYRHGFNIEELNKDTGVTILFNIFWVQHMCLSAEFPFEVCYVGAAYKCYILAVSSVKEDHENGSLETIHGQNMSDSSKWDKRPFLKRGDMMVDINMLKYKASRSFPNQCFFKNKSRLNGVSVNNARWGNCYSAVYVKQTLYCGIFRFRGGSIFVESWVPLIDEFTSSTN